MLKLLKIHIKNQSIFWPGVVVHTYNPKHF